MKGPFVFAVFLLALFAQGAHAAFNERILVQVFDQNLRPVEGASAYAEYQLNAVAGYVKTKPVYTDKSGQVNVSFSNYEVLESSVQYSYTLFVKYGEQISTYQLIAGNTSRVISETGLKSYVASLRVRNQLGSPLRAAVGIGGKNSTTDEAGAAYFQLPPGNYTARAEIEGAVRTRQVMLDQDLVVDLAFGLYPLQAYVKDERRNPLNATVEVDGRVQATDENGLASFANVTNPNPQVLVRYGEKSKKFLMDLERQTRQDVVFDGTRPEVKELHATPGKGGAATLSMYVEDAGPLASGIDSVLVSYEVEGVENRVPAYATGYNTFEARIPAQPPKTLVKYTVKVADREGNSAFSTGSYVVPEESQPQSNGTASPPAPGPSVPSLGVETVIIALVVFALLAYGALYYLRNRGGQGAPPAQPEIPSQPQP